MILISACLLDLYCSTEIVFLYIFFTTYKHYFCLGSYIFYLRKFIILFFLNSKLVPRAMKLMKRSLTIYIYSWYIIRDIQFFVKYFE